MLMHGINTFVGDRGSALLLSARPDSGEHALAFTQEPEVDAEALTQPTSRGLVADLSQAQSMGTYTLSLVSPGMTAPAALGGGAGSHV